MLWVNYIKISIYPILYLLKGDYKAKNHGLCSIWSAAVEGIHYHGQSPNLLDRPLKVLEVGYVGIVERKNGNYYSIFGFGVVHKDTGKVETTTL